MQPGHLHIRVLATFLFLVPFLALTGRPRDFARHGHLMAEMVR
jgi:hypothetical protein